MILHFGGTYCRWRLRQRRFVEADATGLHCCSRQLFGESRSFTMTHFVSFTKLVISIMVLTKEDVKDEEAILR